MIRFLARHRASLALALLLLAGAVMAQVAAERNRRERGGPVLSSRDAGPAGALALAVWLERLGYQVVRLQGAESSPDDAVDLLFVLRPTRRFERAEARATLEWVRRGGVLVYLPSLLPPFGAAPSLPSDGLQDELGLSRRFSALVERTAPSFPFFTAPAASRFALKSAATLALQHDAWVPLLGEPGQVLAAMRQLERGRVYAVAAEALFANEGIEAADNAAFVLNVLARHPSVRMVAFDEYHHGVVTAPSLLGAVRSSPWGWAIVYAAAVSFSFLLWGGRRFGPAIVPERLPGRSTGDYITAFAGLLQRARATSWAQAQYAQLVRHSLARAHGVRADLPATELARLVSTRRPVDPAALAEHLAALDGPPLGARALLARVRAVERLLPASRGGETGD